MASQNNLNAVFTDIANAIRDKKGSVDTIKPINMADEILTIETGGGKSTIYKTLEEMGTNWSRAFYVDNSNKNIFGYMTELSENDLPPSNNVVNMSYMFRYCTNLTTIPQIDTSSATDTSYMFGNCTNLTSIPPLDTSKSTYMFYMFGNCTNLTTIPQLDTSKVNNISSLFLDCTNLTSIPPLDTSSCTAMSSAFQGCNKLEKIDITKFIDGTNYNYHFAYSCYSLKTLIIRTMDTIPALNSNAFTNCYHFYGTTDATYNPNGLKDGRIYVPDDKVESLKTATNWSVFADIIKPLSEYTGE